VTAPRFPRRGVARALLGGVLAATLATAVADESRLQLAVAPGSDLVTARCVVCHSIDYILMNAPIQGRAGWEATVNKMIKVMQAPITPDEAATIVGYLDGQYGNSAAADRR